MLDIIHFETQLPEEMANWPDLLTLDIETKKISGAFQWPSGERNGKRWQPIVAGWGLITAGRLEIMLYGSDEEAELINACAEYLTVTGVNPIHYAAATGYRPLDEMVLRGKFINARRSLAREPGDWPNLDDMDVAWKAVYVKEIAQMDRCPFRDWDVLDCESKLVTKTWRTDHDRVYSHCLRDVVENLILMRPELNGLSKFHDLMARDFRELDWVDYDTLFLEC